ncbi:MAG: TetR/AcrR family transcriptional regulator, partial [Solirubrobacteraceae bacterium]
MSVPTVPPRARRADAQRNHERVLRAAGEVLSERGLEAGVDEIAARAGVGKATVYRSFPTKEHLIAAVVIDRLGEFEQRARAQRDAPDA